LPLSQPGGNTFETVSPSPNKDFIEYSYPLYLITVEFLDQEGFPVEVSLFEITCKSLLTFTVVIPFPFSDITEKASNFFCSGS